MKRPDLPDPSRVEVQLPSSGGGVFVSPAVDPKALQYAEAVKTRRKALSKHTAKVGGAHVPIPKLDSQHREGLTMAQQAMMQRGPTAQEMREEASRSVNVLRGAEADTRKDVQGSIVELPAMASLEQPKPGVPSPASLGIVPTDTLPVEATKDPAYRSGYGSMFAASQPNLAMRYGVIRNGAHMQPHQLRGDRGPTPTLSPQSVRDLETLKRLQEMEEGKMPVGSLHSTEREAAESLKGSAAEASARAMERPVPKDDAEKGDKSLLDELDIDRIRQRMMNDILNNERQREIVEARLAPLDVADLIMQNRLQQVVPILPNKFWVTFQSMTGDEDLQLKRLIMQDSPSVEVSERYLLDKFALMSIAVGLFAVNGKPLGNHEDDRGCFDDERFWVKFKRVIRLPMHMLASIGAHHYWFESRVRKLFVVETVGNG